VTQIQTAGMSNRSEDGTIHYDEPIIGFAYARAKADGELAPGDLITSLQIDDQAPVIINNWDDIIAFFRANDKGTVTINYIRDNVSESASYDLISKTALNKLGFADISFQIGIVATEYFDWGYTLAFPFVSVYRNTTQVLSTIGLLFNPNEDLGIRDLSGPIGIFGFVSNTRSQGVLAILSFTAFLSINIGLLNLLPIPALDGGRLVFLGIEAATRKPLNRKLENSINNVMFILLLGLFIFVTFNDILRIFGG
jgi:regulator of sigma E protease